MEQQSKATPETRLIVNWLRNSAGIKTRPGALAGSGKRLDYFKGSSAIKAILSPSYEKLVAKGAKNGTNIPRPIKTEAEAQELLHGIIPYAFFLRIDRGEPTGGKGSPREIRVNQQQMFKPELVRNVVKDDGDAEVCADPSSPIRYQHYAYFFEGSQLALKAGGFLMIFLMLAGVMFPLWPPTMRLGVWYLSMGFLGLVGLFFGIAIVRLIFWVISLVILRPGVWIFPNLFEDVGFVDSFIPLWAWDIPPPKKEKKRKAKAAKASASSSAEAKQQAAASIPGGGGPAKPSTGPAPAALAASSPAQQGKPKQATVEDDEDEAEAEGQEGEEEEDDDDDEQEKMDELN